MDWHTEVRRTLEEHGRRVDESVVEEMAQHAEAAWQSARADGAAKEAAEDRVRGLIAAWCRSTDGPRRIDRAPLVESAPASGRWFSGLGLDMRHSLRLLRRQPAFAIVSILMIALGIAATSAIFSVVNGVLLKPLPWPNAPSLVRVSESRRGGTVNLTPVFSNATYLAWQEHATTIDAIAGYSETTVTLDSADGSERIPAARVTASLFPLLGVAPLIGPGFTAAEDERPIVVLSYGFWRERFGGAADVIGRKLSLASGPATIVAVMPAGFAFPTPDARFWLPAHIPQAIRPGSEGRTVSLFNAVARLKSGATPGQAAAEAERAARALPYLGPVIPAVFGSEGEAVVTVVPLADALVGDVRPVLWLLLAAVVLLWLAAIGNVASMQMSHAVARRREVAIRAAIGAGSRRLVRQLLVENAVLGLAGGLLGLLLTVAILRALPVFLPADFPRADTVVLDGRVVAVGLLLSLAASALIAALPARLAASLDLRAAMTDDAATTGLSRRSGTARTRQLIITSQVAIAAVLLVGGLLLVRSFVKQWQLDRGFDRANVLVARVQLPSSRDTPAARTAAFADLLSRLRARADVRAAGLSDSIPLGGSERRFASTTAEPGQPPRTVTALLREVTPGYLAAIGMRVSEGRAFTDSDTFTSEPVAIVNRTFARRYLGASPVGETLPATIDNKREGTAHWRVIGVLDDVMRASAVDPVQPEVFVSVNQMTNGPDAANFMTVRSTGDPIALTADLRRALREIDTRATLDQAMTMDARLMKSLARPRLFAVLFGGFAVFALLVAMAGLFGGLSYGVTQRTREIGLRTALGATPWSIVRLIVSQGALMTVAGLALGLAAAAFGSRYLATWLYGVGTHDLASFAGVGASLALAAVIACAIPAKRAASIDPLKGLRS